MDVASSVLEKHNVRFSKTGDGHFRLATAARSIAQRYGWKWFKTKLAFPANAVTSYCCGL